MLLELAVLALGVLELAVLELAVLELAVLVLAVLEPVVAASEPVLRVAPEALGLELLAGPVALVAHSKRATYAYVRSDPRRGRPEQPLSRCPL